MLCLRVRLGGTYMPPIYGHASRSQTSPKSAKGQWATLDRVIRSPRRATASSCCQFPSVACTSMVMLRPSIQPSLRIRSRNPTASGRISVSEMPVISPLDYLVEASVIYLEEVEADTGHQTALFPR